MEDSPLRRLLRGAAYTALAAVMVLLHHLDWVSLDTSFVLVCIGLGLYGVWLFANPLAYRRMHIDEHGVIVQHDDAPDVEFQWADVCDLTFLGHEPQMEEMRVTLRDGASHILPFEMPDRSRFLREASDHLGFEAITCRQLRAAAAGGAWTLFGDES